MVKLQFFLLLLIIIFSTLLSAENTKVRNIQNSVVGSQTIIDLPLLLSTPCKEFENRLSKVAGLENLVKDYFSLIKNSTRESQTSSREKAKPFLEVLHFQSHCLLRNVKLEENFSRFTEVDLNILLDQNLSLNKSSNIQREMVLFYADYLINNGQHLASVYPLGFEWMPDQAETNRYIVFSGALITPGLESMWKHCQKRFNWQHAGWNAVLVSGYQSPSYQFLEFVKSSKTIGDALTKAIPPLYGGHHLKIPDIKVKLVPLIQEPGNRPSWDGFHSTCSEFGFSPRYPHQNGYEGELKFMGIKDLYEPIFSNTLIPRSIARDFEAALYETGFFPSPKGLRTIMALSAQESTIQWNPKLNIPKKRTLKQRFNRVLLKLKSSIPGAISNLILSDDHKKELDGLILELDKITNPEDEGVREFDFYLWSRITNRFLQTVMEEYEQFLQVGQWFFDVKSLKEQLQHEPQTFGLWQINVNHLQEKMKSFSQLRRIFPDLYQEINGYWEIDRDLLIKALSGRPDSLLTKKETLELIIYTHLLPRYENHHLGDTNDLNYFIAENMAGEMSTFRSAIQSELNENLKSHLIVDGDLTYYHPYSTKIDWSRKSDTIEKLEAFITKHLYYFEEPVDVQNLIKDLCEARSWNELKEQELYRKIIRSKPAIRKFPEIRSSLYEQTPDLYSKTVLRKTELF
ncbi:hypothetical protein KJ966_29440 [bacterium]|nr:hypothetical protein [bacterium]